MKSAYLLISTCISRAVCAPLLVSCHLLRVDGGVELVGEAVDAVGERDLEPVGVAEKE